MKSEKIRIERLSREEKFALLERLLNDLHGEGLIGSDSLMALATDVMQLDYREDEDLLCFACLPHENEEE